MSTPFSPDGGTQQAREVVHAAENVLQEEKSGENPGSSSKAAAAKKVSGTGVVISGGDDEVPVHIHDFWFHVFSHHLFICRCFCFFFFFCFFSFCGSKLPMFDYPLPLPPPALNQVYESQALLDMYLALHFPASGSAEGVPSMLPHQGAPDHALRFPQRVRRKMQAEIKGRAEVN